MREKYFIRLSALLLAVVFLSAAISACETQPQNADYQSAVNAAVNSVVSQSLQRGKTVPLRIENPWWDARLVESHGIVVLRINGGSTPAPDSAAGVVREVLVPNSGKWSAISRANPCMAQGICRSGEGLKAYVSVTDSLGHSLAVSFSYTPKIWNLPDFKYDGVHILDVRAW